MEGKFIFIFSLILLLVFFMMLMTPSTNNEKNEINNSSLTENKENKTEVKNKSPTEEELIMKTEGINKTQNEKVKNKIRSYVRDFGDKNKSLSKYVHSQSPDYRDISLSENYGIEERFLSDFRESVSFEDIEVNFSRKGKNDIYYYRLRLTQKYKSTQDNQNLDLESDIEDTVGIKKEEKWKIWTMNEFIK